MLPAQFLWRLYSLTLPLRRWYMRRQPWPTVHGLRIAMVAVGDEEFAQRKLTDVLTFLAAEDPRALRAIQRQFEFLVVRSFSPRPRIVSEPSMHACMIDPRILRHQHRDIVASRLVGSALEHRLQTRRLFTERYGPRAAVLVLEATFAAAKRYPYAAMRAEAWLAKEDEQGAGEGSLPDA